MEFEIAKISDDLVHIHDASNYAREALATHGMSMGAGLYANERTVTTRVADGAFSITVRIKGSLSGYKANIPLLGGDLVEPKHLDLVIEKLKALIK